MIFAADQEINNHHGMKKLTHFRESAMAIIGTG